MVRADSDVGQVGFRGSCGGAAIVWLNPCCCFLKRFLRRSEDEARVGSQLERTPFSLQSLVHSSQAVAVYTAVDGRNGQRCIIKLKKISGNLTTSLI